MAEQGAYSSCGLDAGVKNEGKGEMYMFGNGQWQREKRRGREGKVKVEVKEKEFVHASGDTKNNYKVLSRVLFGGVNERELLGR
jgi:hypothetical protein